MNPANKNGNTPFHLAARKGYLNICELIMEHIEDLQPKNNEGKTPFDLAWPHEDVMNAIVRQQIDRFDINDDSVVILD